VARGLTTSFAGIALNHVPGFVAAQLVGAGAAAILCRLLSPAVADGSSSSLDERI
jgi:hypothetical protein